MPKSPIVRYIGINKGAQHDEGNHARPFHSGHFGELAILRGCSASSESRNVKHDIDDLDHQRRLDIPKSDRWRDYFALCGA
jgi:hypothetical protein